MNEPQNPSQPEPAEAMPPPAREPVFNL
ncbi:rhomboid family intramembrane serine protease, partial [Mesorhizobium sp. M8A.F.Ca.ET.023.01.1.1]